MGTRRHMAGLRKWAGVAGAPAKSGREKWRCFPMAGGGKTFVRDGDLIRVDIAARSLDLLVDPAELAARHEGWAPLPPRYTRGVLAKYSKLVHSAAEGAITG